MRDILKIPNNIYDKGWKWAAREFGTECDGRMLSAPAARALDCYIAGYYAGLIHHRVKFKKKRLKSLCSRSAKSKR